MKTTAFNHTAKNNEVLRPIVLIFIKFYLPGYKSGGPVRSIANMVEQLGDDFEFKIVTSDRDWVDTSQYSDIKLNAWNDVGRAQVFYLSPEQQSFRFIARLLTATHYDLIYLNSYFDFVFTQKVLWARKLGFTSRRPVIIAPRGEFSPGAFAIKYTKKYTYVLFTAFLKLYKNVIWHASTGIEEIDIRLKVGGRKSSHNDIQIMLASDIASVIPPISQPPDAANENDALRVVFVSRITPKKNLDFALQVLADVNNLVYFDIYGPIGEQEYWQYCNILIKNLPSNVIVEYKGVLPHDHVVNIFETHDLFFFPTHGENYGHVIIEALQAGTPILISDETPWQNLQERGVGWDLALENKIGFVSKIEMLANMSAKDRCDMRMRVREFALEHSSDTDILTANRELFNRTYRNS